MSDKLSTKFTLKCDHKTYFVTDEEKYDFENHIEIYIGKYFLDDITDEEKKALKNHTKYIRIITFQDSPTSQAYIKCYCRNMDEMSEENREDAEEYLQVAKIHENLVLAEITYSSQGMFSLCLID